MREITLSATAGPDGRLHLDIPAAAGEYDIRVTLTPRSDAGQARKPSPEELGWPPGYFERTFGSIPDFSVEPREVDVREDRDEF